MKIRRVIYKERFTEIQCVRRYSNNNNDNPICGTLHLTTFYILCHIKEEATGEYWIWNQTDLDSMSRTLIYELFIQRSATTVSESQFPHLYNGKDGLSKVSIDSEYGKIHSKILKQDQAIYYTLKVYHTKVKNKKNMRP